MLLERIGDAKAIAVTSLGGSHISTEKKVQLSKLIEDDVEVYLTTFERLMQGYSVKRAQWSYKLTPNLTGKA